jgi:hypothetical protein
MSAQTFEKNQAVTTYNRTISARATTRGITPLKVVESNKKINAKPRKRP